MRDFRGPICGAFSASSHARKPALALHRLHLAHELLLAPAPHHLLHLVGVLVGQ
jgi:hypothetical protein